MSMFYMTSTSLLTTLKQEARKKFEEEFTKWGDLSKPELMEILLPLLDSLIDQTLERVVKDCREISDAAILRMQIMGVELAGRQQDDEAVKIINDIRGKYEGLFSLLPTQSITDTSKQHED